MLKFRFGASPIATIAFDSHKSLLDRTLLSLTDSNGLAIATGSLVENLELSAGGELGDFLEIVLPCDAGLAKFLIDP